MKRPDTIVIFGPVEKSPKDTAAKVLTLILDDLHGSLGSYFARLEYDSGGGSYEPTDEYLDLSGRQDLLERIDQQHNCMWRCYVPMGFANGYVYPAVFLHPSGKPETTLLLDVEPTITRFVETAAETRIPFAIFLARVAHAVGSLYYVGGLHSEWKTLPLDRIMDKKQLGPCPYIIGWKSDVLDEERLIAAIEVAPENVRRTTLTYSFVTLFPPEQETR